MAVDVEVKGHGAQIGINVLGYENTAAQNTSDANWLRCNVSVKVGPFSGQFGAAFTTHEVLRFFEELQPAHASLSGVASFQTMEGALELRVEYGSRGVVRITGTAQVTDEPQATLSFSFESDQSHMDQTCQDLEAAVRRFPVIGVVDGD